MATKIVFKESTSSSPDFSKLDAKLTCTSYKTDNVENDRNLGGLVVAWTIKNKNGDTVVGSIGYTTRYYADEIQGLTSLERNFKSAQSDDILDALYHSSNGLPAHGVPSEAITGIDYDMPATINRAYVDADDLLPKLREAVMRLTTPEPTWDSILNSLRAHMVKGDASSEDAFDYIEGLHNLLKSRGVLPANAPSAWWQDSRD